MKAKDLMIPIHDYLNPEDTLKQAVNLLRTARRGEERVGVKGLPVLDENGKLVGMLSMEDILKAVWPAYMSMTDLGTFTWDGMVEAIAKRVADNKVAMYMTRDVMTVKEDAPLMECVDYLVKKNVKILPVVDRAGRVVGMLYERDIFYEIVQAMMDEHRGGAHGS